MLEGGLHLMHREGERVGSGEESEGGEWGRRTCYQKTASFDQLLLREGSSLT